MTAKPLVLIALASAYPMVNHAGAVMGAPAAGLAWLSLVLFAGFVLGSRSSALLWFAVLSLAAALVGHLGHQADVLQRVPPVIIAFSLLWVFGHSLLPGRMPLISRIGERMRSELSAPVARYGYWLTVIWTLFFMLMGLECLLLGLFAPPFWWSLFANFVNYGLIALLLILEYPIRRLVLRNLEHSSFIDSLRGSLRLDLS
jgi:uncharacterized membrane protein